MAHYMELVPSPGENDACHSEPERSGGEESPFQGETLHPDFIGIQGDTSIFGLTEY